MWAQKICKSGVNFPNQKKKTKTTRGAKRENAKTIKNKKMAVDELPRTSSQRERAEGVGIQCCSTELEIYSLQRERTVGIYYFYDDSRRRRRRRRRRIEGVDGVVPQKQQQQL